MPAKRFALPLALLTALVFGPPPAASAEPSAPTPAAPDTTVTLITGDRVTLRPTATGRPATTIEPARRPGRRVSFSVRDTGGEIQVLPSDVAHLVPAVLDPRLFEVTALAAAGFHDGSGRPLPLIVQPARGAAGALPGGRQLPSIGAVAVDLPAAGAATMGAQLAGGPPTRVWLDDTVRSGAAPAAEPGPAVGGVRLDRNLTQIGAPAAWDAGLSGAGVRVAVLDTGVDANHADLAGRVAAQANFTDEPDATDHNGHGTHVASLVAGTGSASGGARRGVAFGATLLSGKVLDDRGVGTFSSIIAGMEWAAAQGAKVVNMSLSSDAASTGRDPLSLAVDALTASHGVLFVTSAGNRGPGATTIGAPGAADAALTVGAVDGRDRLAGFSSRGPRLGDHAIKPDLSAPGVDIVAARAAGTSLGDPVDARYTRLSGTSMAAPHVAGAAALLAERHPQWTSATLKAALVGAAAPLDAGAFDAGSGRLDLGRGTGQHVLADRPSASFGFVSYPQTGLPPMQRTITLTNTAGTATTVDLTAWLSTPDGRSAPAGMLSVSPARLTLPAGGSGAATATLAPALGGFGAFAGHVVATAPDGETRVPVGVVKESTRHVLTLRALDRNGTSEQIETLVTLVNLGDVSASPDPVFMAGGVATVRVRPGFYTVTAAIPTLEEGEPPPDDSVGPAALVVTSVAVATIAELAADRDQEVVLDARHARPISAAVSGVDTVPADVRLFVAARDRDGDTFVLGYDTSAQDVVEGKLLVQPTQPVRHGELELSSKWRLDGADGATYDLLLNGPRFPESLQYQVEPGALTRVQTTYRAPATPIGYREARFVFTELNPVSVAVFAPVPGEAPVRRTEYLTGGSGRSWFQCAVTTTLAEEGIGDFCQAPSGYPQGETVDRAWLRAPLRTTAAAFRTATTLQIGMSDLAEDGPHSGSIASHVLTRAYALYRDGVLVSEGEDPLGGHAVGPGPATFRLTRRLELRPGLLPLSTRVESQWTFASVPPRTGRPPTTPRLLDVAVHLPVDDTNHVPAGVPLAFEVSAAGADWARLELSTDDGRTWWAVPLRRHGKDAFQASLAALPAGALVSIRTEAGDRDGGHTVQVVHNAFAVS